MIEGTVAAVDAAATPLRRNRNFRLVWTSQALSALGSHASYLAYPLIVLALTGSPVKAGLVGTTALTAGTVLQLPAGAIADRVDRKHLMVACDIVRAAALGALVALIVGHVVTWWAVLIVALVDALVGGLFGPAQFAALPTIVPSEQLEAAVAADEGRAHGVALAGPPLGGALFGLSRFAPFLADAVSYIASFTLVSRLRGNFRARGGPERRRVDREIVEGLRLVLGTPLLRALLVQAPLINFAWSGAGYTVIIALRRHGTAPAVIGLVESAIATGGLVGAFLSPRIQRRFSLAALLSTLNFLSAALCAVTAVLVPSLWLTAPLSLTLLLAPALNASITASFLRTTPEHLRGRGVSTMGFFTGGLQAIAPLTGGLLLAQVSAHWALGVFAGVLLLCALGSGLTLSDHRTIAA
jgi:MFS family permease